jgi:hypothetical protein
MPGTRILVRQLRGHTSALIRVECMFCDYRRFAPLTTLTAKGYSSWDRHIITTSMDVHCRNAQNIRRPSEIYHWILKVMRHLQALTLADVCS